MSIKCLITSGCSFSQVPSADVTWPVHLNEALRPEKVYYLGQGAAGNGMISRRVIYNLTECLKHYSNEDILVGIMWSGCDRREIFSFNKEPANPLEYGTDQFNNPSKVVGDNNYYIMNEHWDDELTLTHKKVVRAEHSIMLTLEHILRVQWFLKLHNIKYFMTEYDYDVFAPPSTGWKDKLKIINSDKDLKFLYDQIDLTHWLPIENMYAYAKFESWFDFARPPDPHPSTEQHKEMVIKILLPFLKNKYNIE